MNSTGKWFDRIILLLLIAVQAVLCYNFYVREIAWYPPANFDQTGYLTTSYFIEDGVRHKGFIELARAIGNRGHPTGVALPIEGALFGLIFGGARLPQLLVIFLAFCALQVFAFTTARAVWNSRAHGYMLLGLILCQTTAWYWAGGLFDFRFDFVAYCLYGIWVCAALRSRLFLDRKWAIACGLIGAFLVLQRFLTFVYLVGISAGFAAFCIAVGFLWRADKDLVQRIWKRLSNLAISVGVLAVLVAPFFIRNWESIYNYYGIGHGVSIEKDVYARELGIGSLTDHLLFYPKSILQDHWGLIFLLGAIIAVVSSLIARFLDRRKTPNSNAVSRQEETFLLQIVFLLGAILGPIVVLTIDIEKSPVVGSIVGVPAALLVVVLATRLAPVLGELKDSVGRKIVLACSLVIFAMGVANVFYHLHKHLPEYAQRRDLERLVDLNKWLVAYAGDHGWTDPAISFDVLSPWFQCGGITDTGFEESGKLVWFHVLLSNGMAAVKQPEALALLAKSDFLVLTGPPNPAVSQDALSVDGSRASIQQFPNVLFRFYPFWQSIAPYWNDLKAWADKNMILAKTVQFDNFTANVYVRSAAPTPGLAASIPAVASPHATYISNFPLTENPISEGGRWINGKDVGLDWQNARTTAGLAFGTQSGNSDVYDDSTAVLTGTWGPNQTAQGTVKILTKVTSAIEELELRLRTTITPHSITGYEICFRAVHPGGYMAIVRWNGPLGSFTTLTTNNKAYQGIQNGDVIKASIVGSTITVWVNGVVVGEATDSKFRSGSPGVGFWLNKGPASMNSDCGFTSFSATDGSMTAPAPAPTASRTQTASVSLAWNANTASISPLTSSPPALMTPAHVPGQLRCAGDAGDGRNFSKNSLNQT
jgi:hypothetical protein